MALPIAPIDIMNMAADQIGEALASSINPPVTEIEKRHARHYEATVREVLRIGLWNFAIKRAILSRNGTAPLFGFPDQYQLPNDCVRFITIQSSNGTPYYSFGAGGLDYEGIYQIEGRNILINASGSASLNIKYISFIEDVKQWDPLFLKLVVLYHALAICYQTTKKQQLVQMINGLIEKSLPDALSIDGQERPPIRRSRSRAIQSRFYGRGSRSVPGMYTIFDV